MFRFSKQQPDAQMFTDIQNLNALSPEQLAGFVAVCSSILVSGDANSLTAFAQKYGIKEKALQNSVRSMLLFLTGVVKNSSSEQHITQDLSQLGTPRAMASG